MCANLYYTRVRVITPPHWSIHHACVCRLALSLARHGRMCKRCTVLCTHRYAQARVGRRSARKERGGDGGRPVLVHTGAHTHTQPASPCFLSCSPPIPPPPPPLPSLVLLISSCSLSQSGVRHARRHAQPPLCGAVNNERKLAQEGVEGGRKRTMLAQRHQQGRSGRVAAST